ncbi:MAG: type VII secretion protein EssC [Clostridia bacterium]|nr:type VII secretion protein EssC [Clostridia bacterium]
MLVTLIGKNTTYSLRLPNEVEGSYWIRDENDKPLLNIKGRNKRWIIVSDKNTRVINPQCIKSNKGKLIVVQSEFSVIAKVMLAEYRTYFISTKYAQDIFVLYCTPNYEKNSVHFNINSSEVFIGRSPENDIIYNYPLINVTHCRIFMDNGVWSIENFDTNIGTFVNNAQINDKVVKLKNGDIIHILGIKIILLGDAIHVFGNFEKVKFNIKNLIMINEDNNPPNEESEDTENQIDDGDISLYSEGDYFYRAPNIVEKIKEEDVSIEPPPQKKSQGKAEEILGIVTSLSMGCISIIMLTNAITRIVENHITGVKLVTTLMMPLVMLIASLIVPIIKKVYEAKKNSKYEKKRQYKYRKYINKKIMEINKIMEKQSQILKENYVDAYECERIILETDPKLWKRKITDDDFLAIRAGKGDFPLQIHITDPRAEFSLDDDELKDIYAGIASESRTLKNAPISISLAEKNIIGLICDNKKIVESYAKNMIVQLVALQSYSDLKLVFLVNNEKGSFEYAKTLPHVWSESNEMRFYADNYQDMKQVSKYLEDEFQDRLTSGDDNKYFSQKKDYKNFTSYYIIITNDYMNIYNLGIMNKILKSEDNLGFSLLCITNNINQLPTETQLFVNINEDKCEIIENQSSEKTEFILDNEDDFDFEQINKILSNIPIKITSLKGQSLPSKYNFLEMFKCGNIEQLNIFDRWKNNDSTITLQAQIGIDSTGQPIYLDAHEKFHGPHGLIAGTTGSGKSEFIITYVLSLAINYHPDDVTFVLVDYKGGGLAGAFKKKDIQLPHLVGTITNIDQVGLQRSLESIQSELKRRQVMFNLAKEETNESTIDIYKYQKHYHEGDLKDPISHLFIICDEFAELKQQQPDFMNELMSVSRIGRSLGVHLILATQKPAGIVNDQIRSNSKFGICLKVQSKSDSKDIIQKPDAATIKKAGQFYINVGNDEYFALGQSGYTGAPYVPSDSVAIEIDESVDFISNTGDIIKNVNVKNNKKISKSDGDQLSNVVKYICGLAKEKNITEKQLWLDPIPEEIYVDELREKYNVKTTKNVIKPIIGEYDDPSSQFQGILTLNFSDEGNTIIYGSADSGKELLVNTIIYDITTTHTTEEVEFYIFDFAAEVLKIYKDNPFVGDVVCAEEAEKVNRFFKMLNSEIKERKEILAEYNGDYKLYNKKSGKTMPMMIIIMNDLGQFLQEYPMYEGNLNVMTKDCTNYGIVFCITVNNVNEIRGRLTQNFRKKLVLQLIKNDDYYFVFNKARKKRPSALYGRGLVTIDDDEVYEFQTARMCNLDNMNEFIKRLNDEQKKHNRIVAESIPVLPDYVEFNHVKSKLTGIDSVPLGISGKTIRPYTYDFSKDIVNIITAKDTELCVEYTKSLIKEFDYLESVEIRMYDFELLINETCPPPKEALEELTTQVTELKESKGDKHIIYIIIGIDKFMSGLLLDKDKFAQVLGDFKATGICNFIIVENATKLKTRQMDNWYKTCATPGNALWIGSGIDSQYTIAFSNERRSMDGKCGNSKGYIIVKEKAEQIKLLGMKEEEEDEDE